MNYIVSIANGVTITSSMVCMSYLYRSRARGTSQCDISGYRPSVRFPRDSFSVSARPGRVACRRVVEDGDPITCAALWMDTVRLQRSFSSSVSAAGGNAFWLQDASSIFCSRRCRPSSELRVASRRWRGIYCDFRCHGSVTDLCMSPPEWDATAIFHLCAPRSLRRGRNEFRPGWSWPLTARWCAVGSCLADAAAPNFE